MNDNLTNLIKSLKPKITKDSNAKLHKLMIDNLDKPLLYKKYKDQLIINNIRLVVQKVMEYIKTTNLMIFDDLVQEGIIGLSKSVETFNPELKYNFSTWASIHIKKYILRFMDSMYMPKPHTQITENIDRIRKVQNKLIYENNITPTPEEVKKEVDKQMKTKSKDNKKLNKKRLKKYLSPLSEQIGIDKNGKFIGMNINNIKYIMEIINDNKIIHSINIEQGSKLLNDNTSIPNNMDNGADSIIGNIFYKNMYEEVISLISILSVKEAEIIDMLLGISYERPYSLEEISTVLYNPTEIKRFKYAIPILKRFVKKCIDKIKVMDDDNKIGGNS